MSLAGHLTVTGHMCVCRDTELGGSLQHGATHTEAAPHLPPSAVEGTVRLWGEACATSSLLSRLTQHLIPVSQETGRHSHTDVFS